MTEPSMDALFRGQKSRRKNGRFASSDPIKEAVAQKEAERDATIAAAEARNAEREGPGPRQVAREAIAAAERAGDTASLKQRIAEDAGLPAGIASRLHGDDAASLQADAAQLASELSIASADDAIRGMSRHGGQSTAANAEPELPPTSFDGGARSPAPPPPPTMGALIRGSIAERQENAMRHAQNFDR